MPLCKGCRNEYWKRHRASSPETRARYTDYVRRSRLLKDYGMTQADYERMLFEQGGKCKLCNASQHGRKERFRYWNIDHDHKTGRVRGLLCHTCNIAIGKYEQLTDKVGLQALITYLKSQEN